MDRLTDGHQTVTLRLLLDAAKRNDVVSSLWSVCVTVCMCVYMAVCVPVFDSVICAVIGVWRPALIYRRFVSLCHVNSVITTSASSFPPFSCRHRTLLTYFHFHRVVTATSNPSSWSSLDIDG